MAPLSCFRKPHGTTFESCAGNGYATLSLVIRLVPDYRRGRSASPHCRPPVACFAPSPVARFALRPFASCRACGNRLERPERALYCGVTCVDEDEDAGICGQQRGNPSAERFPAAIASVPFRAALLKTGCPQGRGRQVGKRRQPAVIGKRSGPPCASQTVNQGGTARAFSRPWAGKSQAIGEEGSFYWPR